MSRILLPRKVQPRQWNVSKYSAGAEYRSFWRAAKLVIPGWDGRMYDYANRTIPAPSPYRTVIKTDYGWGLSFSGGSKILNNTGEQHSASSRPLYMGGLVRFTSAEGDYTDQCPFQLGTTSIGQIMVWNDFTAGPGNDRWAIAVYDAGGTMRVDYGSVLEYNRTYAVEVISDGTTTRLYVDGVLDITSSAVGTEDQVDYVELGGAGATRLFYGDLTNFMFCLGEGSPQRPFMHLDPFGPITPQPLSRHPVSASEESTTGGAISLRGLPRGVKPRDWNITREKVLPRYQPLWDGLVSLVPFTEGDGTPRDVVYKKVQPTWQGTGSWSRQAKGSALNFVSSGGQLDYPNNDLTPNDLTEGTVLIWKGPTVSTGYRRAFAAGPTNSGSYFFQGLIDVYATGLSVKFRIRTTDLDIDAADVNHGPADVWVFRRAKYGMSIWQNGIQKASNTAWVTLPEDGDFSWGNWRATDYGINAPLYMCAMWHRALTDAEIKLIGSNPSAIITPRPLSSMAFGTTGGGITPVTGALDGTLPGPMLGSFDGVFTPSPVTGALDAAMGSLTGSFAGTFTPLGVTGALDGTLPSVTGVFEGTFTPQDITGSLAGTLGALAASLSGTFTPPGDVTGVLGGELGSLAGSFSGTFTPVAVTGTLAGTLPSVTADFSGVFTGLGDVTGTLSAQLAALTGSFSGDVTNPDFVGTLAGTLPSLRVSLSGLFDFGWSPADSVVDEWTQQSSPSGVWTRRTP